MVTIKDVARESGCAISTVSNVLNNVGNVAPETTKRVLDTVERLKYVPNVNAKYLKTNKKNTIGLFVSSVQGDFYRQLVQAVHIQCKINGYILNIYVSNENTSEEIYGMVLSSGVEGAIIMNDGLSDNYIDRLERLNMPIVFIDRNYRSEKVSSITIDNGYGVAQGVEYLIKLGHRRIGYFHGVNNFDEKARFEAFKATMNRHGLAVEEQFMLNGYFEEAVAYSEMYKLLMRGGELPDAFFCANDEMAQGCIRAMTAMGVQVPDQVSVVGFDDSLLAPFYRPALTTVHSPVVELGSKSATEVIRLVRHEGEDFGISIKLKPSLVMRDSCKLASD
ncbi:MAG: LacI family DNA-binding transcriptional regulator [Lachnospiraceae bacterium]|nr:LacI family DNA-binding transcriptional regulator [Lachnospiraceae bacterium]MBP5184095.1 LacI family DNA-binding transcriptional regulator [Lachnospiraceae bacterium]